MDDGVEPVMPVIHAQEGIHNLAVVAQVNHQQARVPVSCPVQVEDLMAVPREPAHYMAPQFSASAGNGNSHQWFLLLVQRFTSGAWIRPAAAGRPGTFRRRKSPNP